MSGDPAPARATPGNPGVPGAPTVLYHENFENQDDSVALPLTGYTSAGGITYTADDYWLSTAHCTASSSPGRTRSGPATAPTGPTSGTS